jgi:hypothetical protein
MHVVIISVYICILVLLYFDTTSTSDANEEMLSAIEILQDGLSLISRISVFYISVRACVYFILLCAVQHFYCYCRHAGSFRFLT